MIYEISNYTGDTIYSINSTGDCVVGDKVCFERATFSGSFRNAKFAGFERIEATIVRDSYGKDKQQHTFTLQLKDGSTLRIKGRNLYANGTYRAPWHNEVLRQSALNEKHYRGDAARAERAERKEVYYA